MAENGVVISGPLPVSVPGGCGRGAGVAWAGSGVFWVGRRSAEFGLNSVGGLVS